MKRIITIGGLVIKGFTLAEVLITLGIIGVIAAMTLSALITKHDKEVTVTSLRKFYSALSQAKLRSEADNGEMAGWEFPKNRDKESIEKFFDKYFRPYLSVINKCTSSENCRSFGTGAVVYTLKDGMQFEFSPNTQNSTLKGNYVYIIVDINGNKAPNKQARDIFYMDIFPKHGAVMLGQMSPIDENISRNFKREDFINGVPINEGNATACCNSKCATSGFKYYACGALIQNDGWKIKDDYPW